MDKSIPCFFVLKELLVKVARIAPWCLTLALLLSGLAVARAADTGNKGWLTNYKDALAAAKADKKVVLADFSGSDWCPPCKALKKDLNKPEFKKLADAKLVLLEVDFPRKKKLPDDVKAQNNDLKTQFKIEAFPTCIVLDGDGKELGRIVGYGGKEEWQKELDAILAKAS